MPELTWIGKNKVITHHLDVPYRVLERQYSFDEQGKHDEDNGSQNMIIHGDNLEALKSLLPKYEGKIDCIYIDPPYNTGNEGWIYNDNVSDPRIRRWLGEVVGKEGEDLTRHDKWLCMMYPRLRLLKQLLSQTGAVFISIDDNEAANLKLICDEIFGSTCFVASIAVVNNLKGRSDGKYIATAHETLLIYRGAQFETHGVPSPDQYDKEYKFEDERGRYRLQGLRKRGSNSRRADRPNMYYPFFFNESSNILSCEEMGATDIAIYPHLSDGSDGCWRWGKETATKRLSELTVRKVSGRNEYDVFQKDYLPSSGKRRIKPKSFWSGAEYSAERGTLELKKIFGSRVFDTPKSVDLISFCLQQATSSNSLVLDSFAGSGTTAHAVLKMNQEDGGNRHFILIELGDYAESVTAARVNRVIEGYGSGKDFVEGCIGSYSYYELAAPLMKDGLLNSAVDPEYIRDYIWYTETHQSERPQKKGALPYYLGTSQRCSYHFIYEPNQVTTLSNDYITRLTKEISSDSFVIYADICTMSASELAAANVNFKKIPRDITRL